MIKNSLIVLLISISSMFLLTTNSYSVNKNINICTKVDKLKTPCQLPNMAFTDKNNNLFFIDKNKDILIYIWSSLCKHCDKEIESLNKLQTNIAAQIIIINIDDANLQKKAINKASKLKNIKLIFDSKNELINILQPKPTNAFSIKRNNIIKYINSKIDWGSIEMPKYINDIFK